MHSRGIVSLICVLLSWAALDDITTDTATSFAVEYTALVVIGAWFITVGAWLVATHRTVAGIGSLFAVALATVAFWSLPHHDAPASFVNTLGYVPLAWFAGLSIWMLAAPAPRTVEGRSAPTSA